MLSRRGARRELAVHGGHSGFVVPLAGGLGKLGVDTREVFGRQLDVDRPSILLEVGATLGARNRDEVVALREHPGDGELRRSDALLLRDLLDLLREMQVGLEIRPGEARPAPTEIALFELVR